MGIYTKEEQLKLIEEHWINLDNIDNQYEDICLEAVKQNGEAIQLVKEQTEEICLESVKQTALALRYVKEQTYELCLEAVKQNGLALRYVKEQTEEICLEAIKQNRWSLAYVKEQTGEMCLEAVKQNRWAIEYVKSKTPIICFYAFLQDDSLLKYKYMQKGIDLFIKSNAVIENNIFCINNYIFAENRNFIYFDINALMYLKDYLLKQNHKNKYILNDMTDIDMLKEIALSNNELILVDTGNINNIHKMLANKIIKEEDLEKESF